MYPRLLHIYGPLWIQSYGVMIAIGFLTFIACTINHPLRKKYINRDTYLNAVFVGLISGIIGGRMLHVLIYPQDFANNWIEVFFPWIGGLVVLGAIIGVILAGSMYLRLHHVPVLPILDLVALYAPLMQSISRIGCLLSGCCYGAMAPHLPWAITFTNPEAQAPLHIPLHPTQIYMSLTSLGIFLILRHYEKRLLSRPGVMLITFLVLENAARFIVDFWRADREPIIWTSASGLISISSVQLLSWCVGTIACILLIIKLTKPVKN